MDGLSRFHEIGLDTFLKGLDLRKPRGLMPINEFDRKNVQGLSVGSYYVRRDSNNPHHFFLIGRINSSGNGEDVFKLPFEWTEKGLKDLSDVKHATKAYDSVDDLVDTYALEVSEKALPLLIKHRLGALFDGSLDENTAIHRLQVSDKPMPVFVCIHAPNRHFNHFKLLVLDAKGEKVQKYEYSYEPSRGFIRIDKPDVTFSSVQEFLQSHNLAEKNLYNVKA